MTDVAGENPKVFMIHNFENTES